MGTELADLVLVGIKRFRTNFALLAASLPILRPGYFVACLTARGHPGSSGEPAGDLKPLRQSVNLFLDYALSSAIKVWYKTGTYGCFCGFERWRATGCNFKRGSARPSLLFFTEPRISAGRRCCAGAGHPALSARSAPGRIPASSRPGRFT